MERNKRILLIVATLVFTASAQFGSRGFCQDLSLYQPVGFQNPLLRSGEFILSTYYSGTSSDNKRGSAVSEFGRYELVAVGYLGITEKMTINSALTLVPNQVTSKYSGPGRYQGSEDLRLHGNISISYRPVKSIEIWGSGSFSQAKYTFTDFTVTRELPVHDPVTGAIIYVAQEITQPQPDQSQKIASLRIGMTYSGNLW